MLTGFTFCIPIKNKTAQEVVTAWRNHISFLFGVCRKLLSDNGTEFKNDLFTQVAEQLGVERKIYTSLYRPQSNGWIEGFHNFLKSCLAKHIMEDQKPVPYPKITTGDLVLVRDHTSKSFMPKYKTDYPVIRVLGNKVEVKDNNGKMSWFHISDMKKTDMVTKSICQLPDYDAFGCRGRLSFDPERS